MTGPKIGDGPDSQSTDAAEPQLGASGVALVTKAQQVMCAGLRGALNATPPVRVSERHYRKVLRRAYLAVITDPELRRGLAAAGVDLSSVRVLANLAEFLALVQECCVILLLTEGRADDVGWRRAVAAAGKDVDLVHAWDRDRQRAHDLLAYRIGDDDEALADVVADRRRGWGAAAAEDVMAKLTLKILDSDSSIGMPCSRLLERVLRDARLTSAKRGGRGRRKADRVATEAECAADRRAARGCDPAEAVALALDAEAIRDLLQEVLTDDERLAFEAHADGMSDRAIGRSSGCDGKTARARVEIARSKLRPYFD